MALQVPNIINGMEELKISEQEVRAQVKKMKNNKAAGVDKIKIELYKEIINSEIGLEILTKSFNQIIERNEIPDKFQLKK